MGKLPVPVEDVDYYIGEIELGFSDDEPFNRAVWLQAKLRELNLNADGDPLRPGEIERPKSETTLGAFAEVQA